MFEAAHLTKIHGTTIANNDLSLSIGTGEILGVLGENGAGKSTLLSILAGMQQPDRGTLRMDDQTVAFNSPADAIRHGVSLVYQHFSLVPTFTIREQLRLCGWKSAALPPLLRDRFTGNERIDRLALGERQSIEIAKALISRPRLLLLDEPTSILTSAEIAQLFVTLQALRANGTSIVLVTHKLREAMTLCDRILVLRQGSATGSIERTATGWPTGTETTLLRLMFGSLQEDTPPRVPATHDIAPETAADDPVVQLHRISTSASPGNRALRMIDLTLHRGVRHVIVGIDGQGQRELAEVCGGYRTARGEVVVDGQRLPLADATAFRHAGIAYLTGDRNGEGTIAGFSIARNLLLKRQRDAAFSRAGFLRSGAIRQHARDAIDAWHIHPDNPTAPVSTLSGGNVQKVLLARELDIASKLIVANNPTQGLDVRTQDLVWQVMHRCTAAGGAALVFLTDIDEALSTADRIAVMFDGRVSPWVPVDGTSRAQLEQMMVTGW